MFVRALLSSAPTRATARSAQAQTWVGTARVACALERHRLATGQWPDALEVLAPRYIEMLPTDLINGQPLRYRKEPAGGFLLYAVGWNEKDDGGTVVWKDEDKPGADPTAGDWVFRVSRAE